MFDVTHETRYQASLITGFLILTQNLSLKMNNFLTYLKYYIYTITN